MPTTRTVTTDAPSGFRQHPLKEFKGRIVDITDEPLASNPNVFLIKFAIAEVEVIEANEPFNFPVTEVEILEIRRSETAWAVFTESLRNYGFSGDINGLIGKRSHWKFAPAKLNMRVPGSDPAVYETRDANAWQVIELEGVENTTNELIDKVAAIADGKDATSFKSAFMSDMTLQGYSNYGEVAQQVMANTFLDFMVSVDKLSFDGTSYHKVG